MIQNGDDGFEKLIGYNALELASLPRDWCCVALDDFADVRGGIAFPHKYQGQTIGKFPFYKVSDMTLPGNERRMTTANHYVGDEVVRLLRAKPFPQDTVVFPKVGAAVYTNKKRLLGTVSLIDNNVMGIVIRDRQKCVPEFLYYWFLFINITDLSNPGPLPSITAARVKKTRLSLPPLSEQKAIALVLRTVQQAKEATEKVIAATRQLKQSLMKHLFTYGPVPFDQADEVELKETEIGRVPKHWQVVTIRELLQKNVLDDVQDGNHGEKHPKQADFSKSGIPFLTANCLRDGIVKYENVQFLDASWLKRLRIGFARPGDVLITHKGTIGETAILDDQNEVVILSPQVTYYRIADETLLNRAFLKLVMETSAFQRELRSLASAQSTRAYVGITKQKEMTLAFPPLNEQIQIVRWLASSEEKLFAEISRKLAFENLFNSLLHHLMTGKVRVPINNAELTAEAV